MKIKLDNSGRSSSNVYHPRLMVNRLGEIVFATGISKCGLTTGILVGKTDDSTSTVPIGKKFTDWEVAGELRDYDGKVTITFENEVKRDSI